LSDIIHLLPESVANQIAAGEVVQRPASVVKELLENALDSGAHSIKLIIRDAGKTLVQVTDDGCGMSETDARMCFERHATSKIFKAEDLFNIHTMGFRGEALASIASVASVELKSRRVEDETGTRILIDGGELAVHEPCACVTGTTVSVKNLFFNIPVRKNFLKSNSIEYKHIVDTFITIALAYPDIQFILFNDKSEIFHLNKGSLRQRITGIFGKKYDTYLVPVEEDTPLVKISGFIGKPDQARKTKGEQYLFVNDRFIRNPYFNHAIFSAFDNLLSADTYPFYSIFLKIPPDKIDVNVHPTKTEVKFEDEKAIYLFLKTAVKKSLSQYHVAPSLDFEQEAFHKDLEQNRPPDAGFDQKIRFANNPASSMSNQSYKGKAVPRVTEDDWKELLSILSTDTESFPSNQDRMSGILTEIPGTAGEQLLPENKSKLIQVGNKYILTTIHAGIMLIHQQFAHQRILFEEYMNILKNKQAASQKQLFPEVIEFTQQDMIVMHDVLEILSNMGFIMEAFGKKAYLISGLPADIKINDVKDFIFSLIEEYKNSLGHSEINTHEKMARALAITASIKQGDNLSHEEMIMLIDRLFACENPYYAPNGKATLMKIYLDEIDKKFN
jgi:DNA mismatch repair protein MutL